MRDILLRRYELLQHSLAEAGLEAVQSIALEREKADSLITYLKLLRRWNERVDLVAPASEEAWLERHIIDSLGFWLWLVAQRPLPSPAEYIDVGSGAGLPGIVLGVTEPERKIVLCEPRSKRAAFLKEVRRELGLANLVIREERMEELASVLPRTAAVAVCRALGKTPEFLSSVSGLLVADGLAVEMVGPSWSLEEEARLVEDLRFREEFSYRLAPEGPGRKLAVWKCFT